MPQTLVQQASPCCTCRSCTVARLQKQHDAGSVRQWVLCRSPVGSSVTSLIQLIKTLHTRTRWLLALLLRRNCGGGGRWQGAAQGHDGTAAACRGHSADAEPSRICAVWEAPEEGYETALLIFWALPPALALTSPPPLLAVNLLGWLFVKGPRCPRECVHAENVCSLCLLKTRGY